MPQWRRGFRIHRGDTFRSAFCIVNLNVENVQITHTCYSSFGLVITIHSSLTNTVITGFEHWYLFHWISYFYLQFYHINVWWLPNERVPREERGRHYDATGRTFTMLNVLWRPDIFQVLTAKTQVGNHHVSHRTVNSQDAFWRKALCYHIILQWYCDFISTRDTQKTTTTTTTTSIYSYYEKYIYFYFYASVPYKYLSFDCYIEFLFKCFYLIISLIICTNLCTLYTILNPKCFYWRYIWKSIDDNSQRSTFAMNNCWQPHLIGIYD